jgi:glycosyltransferase involved in cell wall biosynthesis
MKILILHNRYQQAGGEDSVVAAERALLASHGHQVEVFEVDNDAISGGTSTFGVALNSLYSIRSKNAVTRALAEVKPDVAHVHNTFPVLSPSVYYACGAARIPVVQTLHNFRLMCPGGILLRDGRPCEDCVGKAFAFRGVQHGCYRGSKAGSFVSAAITGLHRAIGTYSHRVQRYIALTEFARNKYVQGGLPADKLVVKPNFVNPDPGPGTGDGGFALYVGRLYAEKGIQTLLEAWRAKQIAIPLKIIGDGTLVEECTRAAAESNNKIEFVGPKSKAEVLEWMGKASFLVFPSIWYEGLPMVLLESFARGTPVVASNLGSMTELITHGATGLHFTPGNAAELIAQVQWLCSHSSELQAMRAKARNEYETKYSGLQNYGRLMDIYQDAIRSYREERVKEPAHSFA